MSQKRIYPSHEELVAMADALDNAENRAEIEEHGEIWTSLGVEAWLETCAAFEQIDAEAEVTKENTNITELEAARRARRKPEEAVTTEPEETIELPLAASSSPEQKPYMEDNEDITMHLRDLDITFIGHIALMSNREILAFFEEIHGSNEYTSPLTIEFFTLEHQFTSRRFSIRFLQEHLEEYISLSIVPGDDPINLLDLSEYLQIRLVEGNGDGG